MSQEEEGKLAALVSEIAKGDRDAFLAIYDMFAPRVYGLTMRILGERMLAEEITQDVFVKLWQHADSFSPEKGSFPTWLLSIARRTAIDRLRYENRRPEFGSTFDAHDLIATKPAEGDQQDVRWRRLRLSFNNIPEEQREVIELAYYFKMSQTQIGEFLGIPLGTVKTRLRLGMEKLRREWDA